MDEEWIFLAKQDGVRALKHEFCRLKSKISGQLRRRSILGYIVMSNFKMQPAESGMAFAMHTKVLVRL